jgi:hypothetical protein
MKPSLKLLCILTLASLLAASCSALNLVQGKRVKPSDNIITERRAASGFTGVDMGTFGRVLLSQGDTESVTVSGSDNLVALVETNVRNGILYIEAKEEFYVTSADEEHGLTFTIVAKEIDSVTISGIGELTMESLNTPRLTVTVSGGGDARISQLTTDDLTIDLSGLGNVILAGQAEQAGINLSGMGDVNSPDLKIGTASVNLSGVGSATLWVMDRLSGEISGVGGVSYHGSPATDVKTSGVGEFKALGAK